MNHASVVRVLAMIGLAFAASFVVPISVAIVSAEPAQAAALIVSGVAAIVVSGSVLLLTPRPVRQASPSDGLAVVILFWALAPVAAAPPFLLGVDERSIMAAIYEAMSCLTTTGHSVIALEDGAWPVSLLVWRGVLHIIGATMSLVTAAAVFAALNLGGPGIQRSVLFTIPSTSFFDAFPRVIRAALGLYAIVFALCFASLAATSRTHAPAEAFSIAVSVVTTGLVDPAHARLQDLPLVHSFALMLGLAASALGLFVLIEVRNGRIGRALRDPEMLVFVGAAMLFALAAASTGLGPLNSVFWSISSLSTSGVSATGGAGVSALPVALLILPALIGGSGLSTAGGVKLARVAILVRRAVIEFSRLGFRDSVATLRFRGRTQPPSGIVAVWVYLIAYVAAVSVIVLTLGLLGVEFADAVTSSVGAVSNAGWLITDAETPFRQAALIVAMGLGRLEILAVLPALNPGFWRA